MAMVDNKLTQGQLPALGTESFGPSSERQGDNLMNTFLKMLRDESGASAAEYALILAIVGTLIAGASVILGGAIRDAMTEAADCIEAGAACDTGEGETTT